jgi:hypothetical protein
VADIISAATDSTSDKIRWAAGIIKTISDAKGPSTRFARYLLIALTDLRQGETVGHNAGTLTLFSSVPAKHDPSLC